MKVSVNQNVSLKLTVNYVHFSQYTLFLRVDKFSFVNEKNLLVVDLDTTEKDSVPFDWSELVFYFSI